MSEVIYKTIPLDTIIDFKKSKTNGSWLTKSIVNENSGDIPVYGASLDENEASYGYIKDNLVLKKGNKEYKVRYFQDCLTWNIDGSVAIFYRKERFCLSEKVIPLLIKESFKEYLDLKYLKYAISLSSESAEFSFSNKAGKEKLKTLSIKIPITSQGEFDVYSQQEIVRKYELIDQRKKEIKEKLEHINEVEVDIIGEHSGGSIGNTIHLPFDKVFSIERGKVISKPYIMANSGEYPVYSTQLKEPLGYIDTFMYDGEYLIWNTDGLGGYIRKVSGKFSITNIVGIMKLNSKFENKIDLDYIKYYLEPIFRENVKGRRGTDEKNEYTKLNSTMIKKANIKIPIPINEQGDFDLEKQNEIKNKFKTIERLKMEITSKALPFTSASFNFSSQTPSICL